VTGDPGLKREAKLIAQAALAKLTDTNQVLYDRTEPNCSADTTQFKGICYAIFSHSKRLHMMVTM